MTTPTRLEELELLVRTLKEIAILGIAIYFAWFILPLLPSMSKALTTATVSEMSIFGLGFKVAQAEQKLELALTTAPQKTLTDAVVTTESRPVAEALQAVRDINPSRKDETTTVTVQANGTQTTRQVGRTFWVYLGILSGTNLKGIGFDVNAMPERQSTIRAIEYVYKRKSVPTTTDGKTWKFGDVVGVVKPTEKLKVVGFFKRPGDQPQTEVVWSEVYTEN